MLTGHYRLKDLAGSEISDDDVHGEMYIKGPCMMNGYLDNPAATAAAIDKDGWLRTGDIAYLNKGKVYIIDRAKVSIFLLQPFASPFSRVDSTHDMFLGA